MVFGFGLTIRKGKSGAGSPQGASALFCRASRLAVEGSGRGTRCIVVSDYKSHFYSNHASCIRAWNNKSYALFFFGYLFWGALGPVTEIPGGGVYSDPFCEDQRNVTCSLVVRRVIFFSIRFALCELGMRYQTVNLVYAVGRMYEQNWKCTTAHFLQTDSTISQAFKKLNIRTSKLLVSL